MPRCFDLNKRKSAKSIYLTEEVWDHIIAKGKGKPGIGISNLVEEDKIRIKGNESPLITDDRKA
jgi:hypothetical protein